MKIDFRFFDIEQELWTLEDSMKWIERSLPTIIAEERKRIRKAFRDADEFQREDLLFTVENLEEGLMMRFLTGTFVISSWAVYESSIKTIASYIAKQKSIELKMSDFRGEFLRRARMFFEHGLSMPLHPAETDWNRLEGIAQLRHALAHANGRMEDVAESERLRKWAESVPGVDIMNGEILVVSIAHARETFQFLSSLIRELIGRLSPA